MRLLHIAAAHLPTKLLVAQHRTIHLMLTACAKGSAKGGMAHYLNHAGFLAALHHDCVRELRIRGGSHASPIRDLWLKTVPVRRGIRIHITPSRTALDIADLTAKVRTVPGMQDARVPLKTAIGSLERLLVTLSTIPDDWLTE